MGGLFEVGTYFPDRSPTWSEVLTVVTAPVSIGSWLQLLSPSSLPAVALGFVGAAILLGPVAQTRVGKQIDRWATEIGRLGRATVIALFAIAVIVALGFEAIPTGLYGVSLGIFLFSVLLLAAYVLHERPIEGWIPESS
jgi:hypothetical protein